MIKPPPASAPSVFSRLAGASLLAAVVVVFVRCSSNDAASGFFGTSPDGGGRGDQDGATPPDEAGGVGKNLPRLLAVVHSADTFDFRVCFATSDTASGAQLDALPGNPLPEDPRSPMPQANYPGIGRGNGAIVDPPIAGNAGGPGFVIPILVDAFALTRHQGEDCKQILSCSGSACLKTPTEWLKLPGLPLEALTAGGTRVLAVTGSGTTLAMKAIPIDGLPAAPPGIGGQLVHLAPTLPRLAATYVLPDGGASLGSAGFGEAGTPNLMLARPDDAKMDLYATLGVALAIAPKDAGADAISDGGASALFFSSLAGIQQASNPSLPPNELFKPGTSYAFVVTGDPAVKPMLDGGTNPDFAARGLHVIAIRSSAPVGDAGPD